MSAAPGRDPCGLLKVALRLQILNIYRASSGLRWICDNERRRNEIRKGPVRSRNSTESRRVRKSYGARWICESPFTEFFNIYCFLFLPIVLTQSFRSHRLKAPSRNRERKSCRLRGSAHDAIFHTICYNSSRLPKVGVKGHDCCSHTIRYKSCLIESGGIVSQYRVV